MDHDVGAVIVVDDDGLEEIGGAIGANYERHGRDSDAIEAFPTECVTERMADVLIVNAVLAG